MRRLSLLSTALLLSFSCHFSAFGQGNGPLRLIKTIPLPHIPGGDFDHFAVNNAGNRLYVVAEVYGSIEVFNLKTGEHLQSLTGIVKSPRKIQFLEKQHALMVADAGSSSLAVFDIRDFHLIARVALEAGPDAAAYDSSSRVFYVGNGGKAAHEEFSWVTGISVDTFTVVNRVKVPAATLKTITIDGEKSKLYATMRDKSQVAVIDLKTHTLEALWTDSALHTDSAMVLDTAHRRLFAGDRAPGKLVVMNMDTGKSIISYPIGDTSDDMTYDAARHRLFVSSADGVDVVSQESPDQYRLVQHVDTFGGKTSIYVPSRHRFYVVHTKSDKASEAALQIFEVE